jgi:hypothetical protein
MGATSAPSLPHTGSPTCFRYEAERGRQTESKEAHFDREEQGKCTYRERNEGRGNILVQRERERETYLHRERDK